MHFAGLRGAVGVGGSRPSIAGAQGRRLRLVISRYVENALRRARYRMLEDRTFCATVPELRGVIANARTLEACREQLAEVVEEWVLVRVARGLEVPSIGGVKVRIPATRG